MGACAMVASAHAHSNSAQSGWKDRRVENGKIEEWKFVYNGSMEWPFSASVTGGVKRVGDLYRTCARA